MAGTLTKAAPTVVRQDKTRWADALKRARGVGAGTEQTDVGVFLTFVDICNAPRWITGCPHPPPVPRIWSIGSFSAGRDRKILSSQGSMHIKKGLDSVGLTAILTFLTPPPGRTLFPYVLLRDQSQRGPQTPTPHTHQAGPSHQKCAFVCGALCFLPIQLSFCTS